ncbi:MAG: bifunctional phosphopantothenoylcysteine decarboxylase/phosphopantothenate--cysteine ligase CoaBC [Candidatus Altarchaeaceae archaeon]
MEKKTVIVTAGGTREFIDPIRFIGNPSTGKTGYAIAKAFLKRNFNVILISAPTCLKIPKHENLKFISVVSAIDMKKAIDENFDNADIIISAAAISDYRPEKKFDFKIKKTEDEINLKLIRNPDILEELGKRKGNKILVGFSVETENLIENSKLKLKNKNLDLIVANDISSFGSEKSKVTIIKSNGEILNLPLMSKQKIANKIVEIVIEILKQRNKWQNC